LSATTLARLDRIAAEIVARRKLDAIAADIVTRRRPVEPAPPPVVNLRPEVLAVQVEGTTVMADRAQLVVEHMAPVVNVAVSPPEVNVVTMPAEVDLTPLEALASRLAASMGETLQVAVERLVAALVQLRPAVTVQPARVVLPGRPRLVLRLETDADGTRRIVQEE
jgi:hypothetical protein